jgi:hypothetical protein
MRPKVVASGGRRLIGTTPQRYIIAFMRKHHWREFGEMGPHLRDRVLGMHQETNRYYTNNNYLYIQLYPMKACDGCKTTSADDHVNNRRKYSSNISLPCEFPSYANVLSGWHQEYAKGTQNGLLQRKVHTVWFEHKRPRSS